MSTWWWNQRRKPFEELTTLHQNVGRVVAPASLQPVRQAAIWHGPEALHREWGQRKERTGVIGGARVDAIEHQAVKMWREIQRSPTSARRARCAFERSSIANL